MVQTSTPVAITTATLNDLSDVYLVSATGGATTVTLPAITCDGMNYRILRTDTGTNSTSMSIIPSGTNLIIQNLGVSGTTGSGQVGNIGVQGQSLVELHSYQNNWYVLHNTSTQRVLSKCIFSTSVFSGDGPYMTCNGNPGGIRTRICNLSYPGQAYERITQLEASWSLDFPPFGTSGTTGFFDVRNANTQALYGAGSFVGGTPTGTLVYNLTNTSPAGANPLPTTPTVLEIGVTVFCPAASVATQILVYALALR